VNIDKNHVRTFPLDKESVSANFEFISDDDPYFSSHPHPPVPIALSKDFKLPWTTCYPGNGLDVYKIHAFSFSKIAPLPLEIHPGKLIFLTTEKTGGMNSHLICDTANLYRFLNNKGAPAWSSYVVI
jgi:hypothetical protein